MDVLKTFWHGLDWSVLTDLLLGIIPALLCITLHELAHALTALRLGDTTARDAGRLTLNPLRHIDPLGMLMMLTLHFGWAKPVPVNMFRFKNPKRGMALTAIAGPFCNLLLAALFLFLYGALYILCGGRNDGAVLSTIYLTANMSAALAVFNVLPIPPLDGSKVLFSLLPDHAYLKLMRYERYGSLVLFGLLYLGVLRRPLSAATGWLFRKLFVFAELGLNLVKGFL